MSRKKGFTLIEMLVVIAIIAVLVAIIVPVAGHSVTRARAATDAANLRIILGKANSEVYSSELENALSSINSAQVKCASFKNAKMYIAYSYPGFIDIMFIDGTPGASNAKHYNMQYFSDVASAGTSTESTGAPSFPAGVEVTWYNVTDGGKSK